MGKAKKARQKKQRHAAKNYAIEIFQNHNVEFSQHNHGWHLIIEGLEDKIDFWPTSETWIDRSGGRGKGLDVLLKRIGAIPH